jgi:hypothetical protein
MPSIIQRQVEINAPILRREAQHVVCILAGHLLNDNYWPPLASKQTGIYGQHPTRQGGAPCLPALGAGHEAAFLPFWLDRVAAAHAVREVVIGVEGVGDAPG